MSGDLAGKPVRFCNSTRTQIHSPVSSERKQLLMSMAGAQQYFVIPLSVQKDGDAYVVGNPEFGDFYQFPEQGVRILTMLKSGYTAPAIKSRLAAEYEEMVDIDEFIDQLRSIGFIHPEDQKQAAQEKLEAASHDTHRTFNVDPRTANAVFSRPTLLCCLGLVFYAAFIAFQNPWLRIDFNAFYTETNRTALLLVVLTLSLMQVALHETGHMLAAARHGIKSKYGVGNRLWTLVAESDLTGILTLPQSQRYFPMLAGLLVDILCASLLTILLSALLWHDASAFTIQVVRALVLEIAIGVTWQFNIFVKTDLYFIICNYFSHPDLDRDARTYLQGLAHQATFGLFGSNFAPKSPQHLLVLRAFSLIWLFGRILSLFVLFGVVLPTMAKYIGSVVHLFMQPPSSIWMACDTVAYVAVTLTMLGTGLYLWLKPRWLSFISKGATP